MSLDTGVTLLWALRSPCNFGCKYCYFGTREDDRNRAESFQPGELSHLGHNDVGIENILDFITPFSPELVRRVFLAGGEPLFWKGIYQTISALKKVGSEVILCTNGLSLIDEKISNFIVNNYVDAVSISLDSYDPKYNDHWRVDHSGKGWYGVVEGIKMLLRKRDKYHKKMKVGVYSVITRRNIEHIVKTGSLVADLGVDYFIYQPISLDSNHKLYDELSLNSEHYEDLVSAIEELKSANLKVYLPNEIYLNLFLHTLTSKPAPTITSCFGGRDLFFIEPDGSVWDCPSMYKIAKTPPSQHLSICSYSAKQLFSAERRGRNTDCSCFSQDCVNMWQLMAFDDILGNF
jgi:sulfatase maturation enzyme AslB (radical SAM superfamily)